MKRINCLLFFLFLLLGATIQAQKVDLSLKFNSTTNEYDVFAKPNFTKGEFLINAGSQITAVLPADFADLPLKVVNHVGEWSDDQTIFAPEETTDLDYHIFTAKGGVINFIVDVPIKLFSFLLPLTYDHKMVRLYVHDLDLAIRTKSNNQTGNFFANEITMIDFYRANYEIAKDIKGHFKDWRGYPMDGVQVTIGNQQFTSLYDGRFEFNNVLVGDATNFSFEKDIAPTAGITTTDLIALQYHLLGTKPFTQAYQWIAADIDNSGTITYQDLELLKRVINGEKLNVGWRFVPINWMDKEQFYKRTIPSILKIKKAERIFLQDFVVIKIGDIDGSLTLKEDIPNNITPSAKVLTINLLNNELKAGQSYEVPFSTNDFSHLTAYQASLKIENAQIIDLQNTFDKYPGLSLKQVPNDVIVVNWLNDEIGRRIPIKNGQSGENHQSETAILELTLVPKKDGLLSDFITLLHEPVRTEAYDTDGKVMTLQLLFRKAPQEEIEFVLYQNRPNPFRSVTDISYFLPKEGSVTLTLSNEAGQVVKIYQGNGQKGFNSFSLDGKDLPKGLLIYQLKTAFGELTKKMLLLN